jgi:hypothetical protein
MSKFTVKGATWLNILGKKYDSALRFPMFEAIGLLVTAIA